MVAAGRVLVVEDDEVELRAICQYLEQQKFTVFFAESADKALSYIGDNIDAILCDVSMGRLSGIDLLNIWKKQSPRTQFILMTGKSSVQDAVAAIKAGAYDYLTKPQTTEKLAVLIGHALQTAQPTDRGRQLLNKNLGLGQIIGQSQQMRQVFSRIQRAAPVDSTVLILGENGTGKELVAQALYDGSPRRNGPFVAVNVAAVPATLVESELFGHVRGAFTGATDRRIGRFEQADGGTLFIDEIGDFDLSLQPKLLRVLEALTLTPVGGQEDRKVNVRVIAATSRNLTEMVRQGSFREDLYYRLNVVQIALPPLRERQEDIPILIDHFVGQIAQQNRGKGRRLSPALMSRMLAYHWPGNVRELHHTLESMMVLADGDLLTENELPDHITGMDRDGEAAQDNGVGLTMEELEKLAIVRALEVCGDNRTHAAGRLGISVRTLQRKLRDYQMNRPGNARRFDA